jgi:fatty-acyl-CoA synthase
VLSGEATPDELIEHVRTSLARYKAPREVVIVDALPRNATGKVLKRRLTDS